MSEFQDIVLAFLNTLGNPKTFFTIILLIALPIAALTLAKDMIRVVKALKKDMINACVNRLQNS